MKTITMRGQNIDMSRLMAQNSNKIALGNAKMNARGDIIGKGGVVSVPREQVARDYHRTNPKAVKQVSLRNIENEVFTTPAQAVAKQRELIQQQQKKRKITDSE